MSEEIKTDKSVESYLDEETKEMLATQKAEFLAKKNIMKFQETLNNAIAKSESSEVYKALREKYPDVENDSLVQSLAAKGDVDNAMKVLFDKFKTKKQIEEATAQKQTQTQDQQQKIEVDKIIDKKGDEPIKSEGDDGEPFPLTENGYIDWSKVNPGRFDPNEREFIEQRKKMVKKPKW